MRFPGIVTALFFISSAAFCVEEPSAMSGIPFGRAARDNPAPLEDQAVPSFFEAARIMIEENHIVAFYGHPNSKGMGILGEFKTIDAMADELFDYMDAYNAVNGGKGVVPAFHIIFATAHPEGEIGIIGKKTLLEYIEYAEANGILVFIDHQIGRYPLSGAVRTMLPYLKYPNVHLAIDPEWATPVPGLEIGSVSADEINKAQEMMQKYMVDNGIPGEKMLVVHQFNWKMISERAKVRTDFPRVLLIHNADGFGSPREKYDSYKFNTAAKNIPLKGFKLFLAKSWRNGGYDMPLLPPEKVLALDPVPILIMYQ